MTRFCGETAIYSFLFILVMSLITLVKGEIKKIQNKRRAFGALLLYLSVLIVLHALMFQKLLTPIYSLSLLLGVSSFRILAECHWE